MTPKRFYMFVGRWTAKKLNRFGDHMHELKNGVFLPNKTLGIICECALGVYRIFKQRYASHNMPMIGASYRQNFV